MSEPAAIGRLSENVPAMRRYAWSLLRNKSDADDLVQDCLLRALDRIDTLQTDGDLRAWLFTIMHNMFVSRWRRMKNRDRLLEQYAEVQAGASPAQQTSTEMQDVLRGLDALADEQREVILLIAVEGFQYDEVARMLGIPVGTVMSRLSRARDRLGRLVQGQERPLLRRVK